MTRPLEVLVVAPHAVVGGQEQWLLQLLDATDRLRPTVLLLQEGPLRAELESRGLPVEVLPVGRRPADLVAPVGRLAVRLRRRRPDVVLANGVKAQFVAGPAARLAGVPLVFVRHDHAFESAVGRLARLADGVAGTTDEVLTAVGRDDAVVVYPPRPPAPLSRRAARAELAAAGLELGAGPVLVMATRLVAYKGVDDAVRALALPGGEKWSLVVVGGDDPAAPGERARLERLAAEVGVAHRVRLAAYLPGVSRLLAAFDALAVLTKEGGPRDPGREGFGMTALEAMAAGVPVVAVGGGAIERRLAGQAGTIVPPADPAAVAAALGGLATAAERRRMGAAGRRLVAGHPDAARSAALLTGLLAATARRPGAGLDVGDGVSVVVPVHNEGAGVDAVVAAVTAQLAPADELVVVDDASTDDTPQRLVRLAARHPRLVPLSLEVNGGPAAARNAGTRRARHELVLCTDAGNDLPSEWRDAMAAALCDAPGADLVTGAYRVSAETPFEQAMAAALYPDLDDTRFRGPLVRAYGRLFGRVFDADRPAGRSVAYRRSAWERAGGWPEHLRAGEDVAFGLAVGAGGRCVLQTDGAVTWRQHATLSATARMYHSYGRGDGLLGERVVVGRNLVRVAAALSAPVLLVAGGRRARGAVVAGGAAYLSLPLLRLRDAADPVQAAALLPVVLAVKDVAKGVGCLRGLYDRRRTGTRR